MSRPQSKRRDEGKRVSHLSELNVEKNPIDQFHLWFHTAHRAKIRKPNAMTLSTATSGGKPSARVVLLKSADASGFVFYTNYDSRKGRELLQNPMAALLFYWPQLDRQIRIEGTVEKLTREESLEYFLSRPRNSRIAAWSSRQGQVIENRSFLELQFKKHQDKFKNLDVPLPEHWGGYRLIPDAVEFWESRAYRLHDRICYLKQGATWNIVRLSP